MATEMRRVFHGLPLLLLLAASCADRTTVVIDFRANGLRAPDDIDRVEVSVVGEGGSAAQGSYPLRSLPESLAIRPAGGIRGDIVVTARAFRGDQWVLQRVATARFQSGAVVRVDIVFEATCRAVVCPGDCENGRCVADVDGGIIEDSGIPDAQVVDLGLDADRDSTIDAARDVAIDAAQDVSVDAPVLRTGILINEIDYNQAGEDTTEFIEIFNAANEPRVLDGLVVFAFNGADGQPYANWALSGTLGVGAYLLIHGPMLTPPQGVAAIPMFQNALLQNSNEGVAIFDTRTNLPVDTLAYGLSSNSLRATIGAANFELVEGTRTAARDSDSLVRSLARLPNGTDTNNASADWLESSTPTPGTINAP